jgi:hypothetical protein
MALGLAVLGAGLLIGQAPAIAAPSGFFIEGRQFFSIDLATGDSNEIGTTGVDERFSSLGFGPDGTLYAVADSRIIDGVENQQIEPAELYTIDTGTGAATLVGELSENNRTGMALALTSLTFSQDGVALMTGFGPGAVETVFVVDIDGTSGGLVPVSRLTDDSGFLTLATDTDCDGRVFGVSVAVPDRATDDSDQPTTDTVNTIPTNPGQLPTGTGSFEPAPSLVGQLPPGAGGPQQPQLDPFPLVLTTIDPATGATTEIGPTGLDLTLANFPGLAIDRASDTAFGVGLAGAVFTVDEATGAAGVPSGVSANDVTGARKPQALAISPASCEQPTTTTTSTTSTTTSTTVVADDPPDPPPAPPATPVTAEPNFTG